LFDERRVVNQPALALLEFDSIAMGIKAGDAMVKRAPVATIQSGTVQPGNYLVMVTGDVAPVEEAVAAGQEVGRSALRDTVFLPNVHPGVIAGIGGGRELEADDALGVVETKTVAAAIHAADAGLVADVEAAVEIAVGRTGEQLVREVIIAQLHEEMKENVATYGRFGVHFEWQQA
jgi:microcompartment protein CcmL/EutN